MGMAWIVKCYIYYLIDSVLERPDSPNVPIVAVDNIVPLEFAKE